MTRTRLIAALTLVLAVPAAQTLRADVRTDQKSKVEFGGALGGIINLFSGRNDGTTSTVAVKGDRKATLNDSTGQIIDLAEEKVYDLDMKRKTYKVTTFEELRRRMEEARKKAEDARKTKPAAEPQPTAKPDPAAKPDPNEKPVEMEVDFSMENTGQQKAINGFNTQQSVMTITVREKGKTLEQSGGLVLKSDIWLAQRMAAMKEVADFDLRYAQKLYGSMISGVPAEQMAMALAMYPMMKDAIAKMNTEGANLEGTPIQTVTTMTAVQSAEAAAEAAKQESKEPAGQSKPSGLGGMLGGMLAKKMAQKKGAEGDGKGSPFLTMTTEILKLTTDVAAQDVAVPEGFKETR